MANISAANKFRIKLEREDLPPNWQDMPLSLNYAFVLDNLQQSLERMVTQTIKDIERLPEAVTLPQVKMLYAHEYEIMMRTAERGFIKLIKDLPEDD